MDQIGTISGKVQGFRIQLNSGKMSRVFVLAYLFLASFMAIESFAQQQVCCPDFYLKDAVEICPPEGQCQGGTAPGGGHPLVACKLSAHNYTVYPNTAPYTYTWTITGGTPVNPNVNPVTVIWGSGTTGFIKVVINGGGCHDSITEQVCLIDGPKASFTAVPNPICAGGTVTFTNTSAGGGSYIWDFGDGTTSTLANPPPHVYPGPGPYTVILTAQDMGSGQQGGDLKRPCGCADTASVVINILPGTGPSIETTCCYGTVCPGDTSSFCTPLVCGTYNWTVTNGVIISGATTNCIKVKWNATYSVPTSVSLSVPGCVAAPCGGSTTLNVPVLYPNLPITGPNPLCVGSAGSFFLPSMPGTFYTWTTNAPPGSYTFNDKDRNVANVNMTFNAAGSWTITCNYNNPLAGCSGTSTFTVNVLPVYSIFGQDKVCQYSTPTYSGSGNAIWNVTPMTGVVLPPGPANFKNITFNAPGFYNVTATPPPGIYCNLNAVKVVQVVAVPILGPITGPPLVCPGSNQAFGITSNTTGSLFTWSVSAGASVQTMFGEDQDSAIIKFTSGTSWTISVYQEIEISPGVLCQSLTQTMVVNAYGPPVITPSPPPAITVCVDGSSSFSATGPSPVTWTVTPASSGSITAGQGTNTVTIRWHGPAGSASVMASHCGGSASVAVNIVDPPFIAAISSNVPTYYCLPSMPGGMILSTSPPPGTYSYVWTGPPGFVPPGNTNVAPVPNSVFSPVNSTYTFTVTASNGTCTATRTITVYIQAPPCSGPPATPPCTVDFTISPNPVCAGQPVTFTVVPNGAGWSYQWSFGDGPSTSYTPQTQHTYLTPGPYNVTLTATLGTCVATKVHSVMVNPTPVCIISTMDTMFCPGDFRTLFGCTGQAGYQWFKDGNPISGATSVNYNATQIGNYWLQVSNAFGCMDISNKIYLYKRAKPIAKITGDGLICTTGGGLTTLNLSSYYNANYTYDWSSNPTGATFSPNNSNASFYTTATLTVPVILPYTCAFIVKVTDVITGCENYDTLCVTFYEIPVVSVPFVSGCEGPSYTMIASPNNPLQYSYMWSNGGTGSSITVSTTGVYSVTVTDKVSGCAASVTAGVIYPLPDLSLFPLGCDSICDTASLQMYIPLPLNWLPPFNTYASAYPNIQWFDNGNYGTPIATGPGFPFSSAVLGDHQISVVVGNVYGCTDTIGVHCINVRHCAPYQGLDFGDAPDNTTGFSYQTLLPGGARHVIVPGVRLGALIDAEPNGQPNIPASGDDINGSADEDGVNMPSIIQIGSTYTILVQASVSGYLDAWIDYNLDGTWVGPGEQIFSNTPVPGATSVTFTVPATASMGQSYARFRFHTSNGTIPFNGLANDGEVEDYPVFINDCCTGDELDFGDAPDMPAVGFNYPTFLANNGARHVVCANIRLGALIDSETNGQPNTPSTGDDIMTSPDEDGVQFVGTMYIGMPATVKVTASIAGFLNAWMDFNKDGDWADAGEQIFTNQPLVPGVNTMSFMIPSTAVQGKTYTRFRFNTIGGLNYFGLAVNGEVEDYRVHDCPHWLPVPTNIKHYITIPHDLQNLYAGDVLGVFYSDASGIQACAGLSELDGSTDKIMIAYGDNPATPVKDGFVVGEPIVWKLCSVIKGDANPVDVTYDFTYPNSNGLFAQNGISALSDVIGLHVTASATPGNICSGDAVQLHASAGGAEGVAYAWSSVPAGFTSFEPNPVAYPTENTTYYVEAFDGVFHANASASVTVTQVNPLVPQLPLTNITIPSGQSNCYNATQTITVAGNGTTFVVQNGGSVNMIAGQKINYLPGTKANSGSYMHGKITTTGAYCCTTVQPLMPNVSGESAGIEPVAEKSFFKVYPNPTTGTFTVELNGSDQTSGISVEIYGILGEKILKKEMSGSKQVFDLTGRQHGVYLIRVMKGSEMGMTKIIKL